MTRLSPLALVLFATGCSFSVSDGYYTPAPTPDAAPKVTWADASCYWDDGYRDFVWWFEADVGDGNGVADVDGVFADVYDEYDGSWVDTFELFWDGGNTYYSSWQGQSTYLDCDYYQYVVDFTAVDSSGEGPAYSLELW